MKIFDSVGKPAATPAARPVDRRSARAYDRPPAAERRIPAGVDVRKVFAGRVELKGSVAIDRLAVFRRCLATEKGSVRVRLRFETDDSRRQLVLGSIEAEVEVACQRCLEPMGIRLTDEFRLVLVKDDAQAARLDPELEPWICPDTRLSLTDLVEEQLLLCAPIASHHEEGLCGREIRYEYGAPEGDEADRPDVGEDPFAALAALKTGG